MSFGKKQDYADEVAKVSLERLAHPIKAYSFSYRQKFISSGVMRIISGKFG